MKTFIFALLASAFSLAALAGSQTLPEPSLAQITGISTLGAETPNDVATTRARQTITGWSADGTKLYAATAGSWSYGYRGSRTASWCGTLTWTVAVDSATGALNPVGVAAYAPGNALCATPVDSWNTSTVAYNATNYGATVETVPNIFSPGYSLDVATLLTP